MLTTYVKFVNLFPEIKGLIQDVFKADNNLRSADAELQQRASEYLQLSIVASADVLATVLEEMPPFPERESSILAILKKKKPGRVTEPGVAAGAEGATPKERKSPALNNSGGTNHSAHNNSAGGQQSADLLGLASPSSASSAAGGSQKNSSLVDVLADVFTATSPPTNGFGASFTPIDNLKKYFLFLTIAQQLEFI